MKLVTGHQKFTLENGGILSSHQQTAEGPASLLLPRTCWATCRRVAGQRRKNLSPPHSLLAQGGLGAGLLHAQTLAHCCGHARTPLCPVVDPLPISARKVTAEGPCGSGDLPGRRHRSHAVG